MKIRILFPLILFVMLAPVCVRAQGSSTPAGNPILIQNATILTITHGNIEHGSILIRDGKLQQSAQTLKLRTEPP
jgi:hypothetical protein